MKQARLVLASSSPRRREILDRLGLSHHVVHPLTDEVRLAGESIEAFVRRLAREKALDGAERIEAEVAESAWIIGADTVVVRDGELLGKPRDADHARRMLESLSDRSHTVLTGWAVLRRSGPERGGVESTTVRFKPLRPAEIESYVASGEPLDKAGAYGIQGMGCFMVQGIVGNYENVVGLPACPLVAALLELGALESLTS